eukprot:1405984-Prymnesium_polylepis.1
MIEAGALVRGVRVVGVRFADLSARGRCAHPTGPPSRAKLWEVPLKAAGHLHRVGRSERVFRVPIPSSDVHSESGHHTRAVVVLIVGERTVVGARPKASRRRSHDTGGRRSARRRWARRRRGRRS